MQTIYPLLLLFFLNLNAQKIWSLEECVNYAAENNLQIQLATINEELTQNRQEFTYNEKYPRINGNFDNSLNLGQTNDIFGNRNLSSVYSNSIGLNANMLLYSGNLLKLNNEKADLETQNQKYNTEQLKNDIALQIAAFYLQVLLNKELVKVAEQQKENSKNQLERTEKLYKAGALPLATFVEQNAQFASDNQAVESAKINVRRALFQLSNLLQLEDYNDFEIENYIPEENISFNYVSPDEVIIYALEHQPKLLQTTLLNKIAEKEVEISKTALLPSISAGYNIGTNFRDFFDRKEDFLFTQWKDNLNQSISVGVQIPIFNKFQTKLNIQQAEINQKRVEANNSLTEISLKQDIQTAFFDAEAAYQQYLVNKISSEAAQKSAAFGLKSFEAGKTTIFDYNILLNNSILAQSRVLQSRYDFLFKTKVLDFYAGKPLSL